MKLLVEGTSLLLPVQVEDALAYVGDPHFAQGDGEVALTAMEASLRATIYAAIFPSAYFFGVVYSEALFLLTLVSASLAFRTRHWMWGAVAAMVMTPAFLLTTAPGRPVCACFASCDLPPRP